MKIDNTVKKETLYIVLGETIFCILMLAVYLICGKFSLNVLIAALVGGSVSAMNFFLMGLTLQKAVKIEDEGNRVRLIRTSQMLRLLLIAVIIIVCAAFPKLDIIALFIPLFFPRIIVFIRGIYSGKNNKNKNGHSENEVNER